jgi:hypothetical protein
VPRRRRAGCDWTTCSRGFRRRPAPRRRRSLADREPSAPTLGALDLAGRTLPATTIAGIAQPAFGEASSEQKLIDFAEDGRTSLGSLGGRSTNWPTPAESSLPREDPPRRQRSTSVVSVGGIGSWLAVVVWDHHRHARGERPCSLDRLDLTRSCRCAGGLDARQRDRCVHLVPLGAGVWGDPQPPVSPCVLGRGLARGGEARNAGYARDRLADRTVDADSEGSTRPR